jgi:hypothetical protein
MSFVTCRNSEKLIPTKAIKIIVLQLANTLLRKGCQVHNTQINYEGTQKKN